MFELRWMVRSPAMIALFSPITQVSMRPRSPMYDDSNVRWYWAAINCANGTSSNSHSRHSVAIGCYWCQRPVNLLCSNVSVTPRGGPQSERWQEWLTVTVDPECVSPVVILVDGYSQWVKQTLYHSVILFGAPFGWHRLLIDDVLVKTNATAHSVKFIYSLPLNSNVSCHVHQNDVKSM